MTLLLSYFSPAAYSLIFKPPQVVWSSTKRHLYAIPSQDLQGKKQVSPRSLMSLLHPHQAS